ncbi:Hypothetical protein A7982_03124 [Minicystis rosea]|nr:Hypothetical protein A7982_03124 [Minicystis rosea]
MKLSIHTMAVDTFIPMLRMLSHVLDRGAEHAREKAVDPSTLVEGHLAPDMYTLALQVRLACDHAQNGTAILIGQEPPRPKHTDEKTIDDLKARIAETIGYLESVPVSAFAAAEDRDIELPLQADLAMQMNGARFLKDWALPHFYFHVVTAYDILRHSGVEIGKRDYLRHIGDAIRPRKAS